MGNSDTAEKILPGTRELTLILSGIYLLLTFFCIVAYWFAGMNIFDSFAHALTTIATGGFSTYSESIGYFQNPKIEIVAIVFIILGSIPFLAYLKFFQLQNNLNQLIEEKFFFQFLGVFDFFVFLNEYLLNEQISLKTPLFLFFLPSSFHVFQLIHQIMEF